MNGTPGPKPMSDGSPLGPSDAADTFEKSAATLDRIVERMVTGEITGPSGAMHGLNGAAEALRQANGVLDDQFATTDSPVGIQPLSKKRVRKRPD